MIAPTGGEGERGVVRFAAKHALLQLDLDGRIDAVAHADRMAVALEALAQRDRELVASVVAEYRDRFAISESAVLLGALRRLGGQDYFWNIVDEALAARIDGLLKHQTTCETADGAPGDISHLAVVRFDLARKRLPSLEGLFTQLDQNDRDDIVNSWPHPYFVPEVVKALSVARTFRDGERVGDTLRKYASLLDLDDLRTALSHWSANSQCRLAPAMPETAVGLFHDTTHLGHRRVAEFRKFLDCVQEQADEDDCYMYSALAAALTREIADPPRPCL